MFVTDPIEPLSNQLNQDPDKNLVLWGLYKVAVMWFYANIYIYHYRNI
jgi:hypothetical protein